MTHTLGPWKVRSNGSGCRLIVGGKSGTHRQAQYREVAFTVGLSDDKEDQANARVLAAAPEMLSALKEVSLVLMCGGPAREYDGEPWIGRVRDAIKKAEG